MSSRIKRNRFLGAVGKLGAERAADHEVTDRLLQLRSQAVSAGYHVDGESGWIEGVTILLL